MKSRQLPIKMIKDEKQDAPWKFFMLDCLFEVMTFLAFQRALFTMEVPYSTVPDV